MTLTFRDTKGSNLTPAEADANIRDLDGRITDLEENPPEAVGISNITVVGTQMTIYLADATVLGPYTLPQAAFRPSVTTVISTSTLTLSPAHANSFLVFTNPGGCVVTLDDDGILSVDQEVAAYAETDGPVTFESPTDIELRPPPGFLKQIKGYGFTVGFKKRAAGVYVGIGTFAEDVTA